jgi:hypothetical protein
MRTMTRRAALAGGVALAAPAIISRTSPPALALDILGTIDKIGAGIVQGIGFGANAAKRVMSAQASITTAAANAIASVPLPLQGLLPPVPINDLVKQFGGNSFSQPFELATIFANPEVKSTPLDFFSERSDLPWDMTSSIEDEARADPYGYVSRNIDELAEFIDKRPGGRVLVPQTLAGRQFTAARRRPTGLRTQGYYPSRMTLGGDGGGLSGIGQLLQIAQSLGPLITLFAAL